LETVDGVILALPGFGKRRDFKSLSQKYIYKCVREALRGKYGKRLTRVYGVAVYFPAPYEGISPCWCGMFKLDNPPRSRSGGRGYTIYPL
jgi:hypothetical protein